MNFALLLFSLLAFTGAVWALDAAYFAKRRAPGAKEPWWIEYPKSFFPVILVVFVLRSFLVEPFKIPSGSMIPTLLIGDFILVNKFTYGIRLPVVHTKLVELNNPKRGDVMVFRYPADTSLDYIKRVVGLPGDRVEYRDKELRINGELVPRRQTADYESRERLQYFPRYLENFGGSEHEVILEKETPGFVNRVMDFRHSGNCDYNSGGLVCTVPAGHYFMMGDNRDNSSDSRVWGFVPDENIVGKAFFIWLNLNELGRFGTFR
ncbi:MAG: signal peptidase I [Candidatus Parcubacteria bacterium]|nr:signal peptidase I [Burkholderiales bacterium]